MENLTVIKVNLQQGLLMAGDEIIAVYNRHSKRVFVKVPFAVNTEQLPEEMEDFEVIHRRTDSFSITMWTNEGYVDLQSLKMESTYNIKTELEARGYCASSLWQVEDVYRVVKELNDREGDDHRIGFEDAKAILEQAFGFSEDKTGGNEVLMQLVEEFLGI